MKVLVINNGSTSSRFSLIETETDEVLASGGAENINTASSYYKYENYKGYKEKINVKISSYKEALIFMCSYLFDNNHGILNSFKDIDVVGHRVVHGGEKYTKATLVDKKVIEDINNLSLMAPLHNANALESIISCQNIFPGVDNVAVFDTSFHLTIPKENYTYAIPKELYEKYGIRKYGFHGISYNYVLNRYSEIEGKEKDSINTVICHMGGGCSMCAIKDGKSVDTTMGYTPLTGLIMANRSGTVDPAIIPKIMELYHISAHEAITLLNTKGGYLAIANDKDSKSIVERSLNGDNDAIFLRKLLNHDFKKNLLSMMSNLNRIDSVILTGGIGAKNKEQREMFMSKLELFGLELDKNKNNNIFDDEGIISSNNSKIPILVIPTNEEKEIAKQSVKVLRKV